MRLGEIRSKTVRKTITENIFRFEVGHETHLLKDKEAYISIMNVTTVLESIQDKRVTPLAENDNQQQIYRWVRKHLLLPSGRIYYTDW